MNKLHRKRTGLAALALCLTALTAAGLLAGAADASGRGALDTPPAALGAAADALRAAAPARAASSPSPSYLWSVVASSGRIRCPAPHHLVLTLRDIDRAVVQFSDRPWRKVYVLHVRDFARDWRTWFAVDDEPNAVLSYVLPGQRRPQSIVLELSPPRYAHGELRFPARRILRHVDPLPGAVRPVEVVRPRTPKAFASASLFIDGAAASSGSATGDLVLFAGSFAPDGGYLVADGSTLLLQQWSALYCALYGPGFTDDVRFSLPNVPSTWPAGAFAGNHGRWLVVTDAMFPVGFAPWSSYPSQVYTTCVWSGYTAFYDQITGLGGVDAGLGSLLGAQAGAYLLPSTWPSEAQDNSPMIGELRLFAASASLPDGWLLADGRQVSYSDAQPLNAIMGGTWGSTDDTFYLPNVAAPDGYRWAIAQWGWFPSPPPQ